MRRRLPDRPGCAARAIACALLLAALLAGCAAPPVVSDAKRLAYWDARRTLLSELEHWTLHGRIAIQLPKQAWSASLLWAQNREKYELHLIGPLGRGSVELSGGAGEVVLQTADHKVYSAPSAEALLQQNLGWQLPVEGLRYWVRGLPEPGHEPRKVVLDERGRVSHLQQNGFSVSYDDYEMIQGYDLPGRITLENEKIRVKLVISSWSFAS